jgi:hypothetical protein
MAKVSVMWMIIILVAFLAALAAFFVNNQELEKERNRAVKAEAATAEVEARHRNAVEQLNKVSKPVGFYDEAKGNSTDPAAATEGLENLKKAVPEVDASTKTLQAALPLVVNAINALKTRNADLDAQVKSRATEIETLQKTVRDNAAKAEADLAALRSQIQDAEQQKADQQQNYDRQLADLREQIKDRDAKWHQTEALLATKTREWEGDAETMRNRMSEMGRKLNPIVKEPQSADGRILSVSKDLGLGWINLGSRQRLPVGARFTVVSGTPGSTRVKANAEVTRVQGDMAEVAFTDQRDPYDPPTSGDVIFNPVYDPRGERNAVLVGSFSGKYGEDQLKQLLASMGVTVQPKLDLATDFLVVGSEMYTDENKQPVETPIQPSDLPVYKEAVANGVQIVLLKDLRNYFRF